MHDSPLPPRLAALAEDMALDDLAFTPVPVQARRDGWTPERQKAFIVRLALCGCVSVAAKAVGKNRVSAYRLRDRPGADAFTEAWDKALGWGRDRMMDVAIDRALHGEVRPIFYKGVRKGEVVRHDDRLALAVLRAHWTADVLALIGKDFLTESP